jgi:predicted Fe-Mo cluster-binding NifX family protein
MIIAISSTGSDLNALTSQIFGRCKYYVFVNTENMESEVVANPATRAQGGAGIKAAEFVVDKGAEAVITGGVGPNALRVFQEAGKPVYISSEGTVRKAVELFKASDLPLFSQENPISHGAAGRKIASSLNADSRQADIEALKAQTMTLQKQLKEVIKHLDELTKEN